MFSDFTVYFNTLCQIVAHNLHLESGETSRWACLLVSIHRLKGRWRGQVRSCSSMSCIFQFGNLEPTNFLDRICSQFADIFCYGFVIFRSVSGLRLFPTLEGGISFCSTSCRRIWRATRAALLWTKEQNKFPDSLWRTTVATYHPGQKVWLSTKHILRFWHSQVRIWLIHLAEIWLLAGSYLCWKKAVSECLWRWASSISGHLSPSFAKPATYPLLLFTQESWTLREVWVTVLDCQ